MVILLQAGYTLDPMIAAIFAVVVVIAGILLVGNRVLADFRDRQVASQERTARVGEESLRVIREEAAETPRPTAPVTGAGEAGVGPALVSYQRESQQVAALRAELEQLRAAQQQQRPQNPMLVIYQKQMDRILERTEVVGVQLGLTVLKLDHQEVEGEILANQRRILRNQERLDRRQNALDGFEDLDSDLAQELERLRSYPEHQAEAPVQETRRPVAPPQAEAPVQSNGNGGDAGDVPPAHEPVTLR